MPEPDEGPQQRFSPLVVVVVLATLLVLAVVTILAVRHHF